MMEVHVSKAVRVLLVFHFLFLFSGYLNSVLHFDGKLQFALKLVLLCLGNILYLSFGSLLMIEIRSCNNALALIILGIATTILILHTVIGIFVTFLKKRINENEEVNNNPDEQFNTNGSDKFKNILRQPFYLKFQEAVNIFERNSCIIFGIACGAIFLISLSTLFTILVLGISIKISVQNQFVLPCTDNSKYSKFIMISTISCICAIGFFGLIDRIENLVRLCRRKETSKITAFRVVRTLTSTIGGVFLVFISTWLIIRLFSIFRDGRIQLYDFISLGILTPLLCVFMNPENNEMDLSVSFSSR